MSVSFQNKKQRRVVQRRTLQLKFLPPKWQVLYKYSARNIHVQGGTYLSKDAQEY